MRKVLVVAAHPDDEVLGCGATVARLAREGDEVHIVILGEGETARHVRREGAGRDKLAALGSQAQEAGRRLGAASVRTFQLPDNRFDSVPLLEVVKQVEEVVTDLQPDLLFTHHGGDLNVDHQVTFRAVLTATRPMEGGSVKELLTFEVPSSTEWSFQQIERPFEANVFYDVSETLEAKVEALEVYEAEVRPFPHPRSPEALRAYATRWGSVVGVRAAEAFELVRGIR